MINGFNRNGILIVGTSGDRQRDEQACIPRHRTRPGRARVEHHSRAMEIAEGGESGTTVGGTTAAARNVSISGNAFSSESQFTTAERTAISCRAILSARTLRASRRFRTLTRASRFSLGHRATSLVERRRGGGARNIISGNSLDGIAFLDSGTASNLVQGNYIGLNAAGTAKLPNNGAGVAIVAGAKNNTVGSGSSGGGRNVISGNNVPKASSITDSRYQCEQESRGTSSDMNAGGNCGD